MRLPWECGCKIMLRSGSGMLRAGFRVPVFCNYVAKIRLFFELAMDFLRKNRNFFDFFCFYSVPFVFRRFPAMSTGLPAQPGLVWANQCQERIGCRFASLHSLPSWRTRSAISCALGDSITNSIPTLYPTANDNKRLLSTTNV